MIKLKANKNNKIQFDIDIQSTGDEILNGHFRLMHENVEYGFPVHILGNLNKAEVEIPALNKLLPNLTESTLDAKLEFVDGCDYIKVWEDKVEIDTPRLSIKAEAVKVSTENKKGGGTITAAPIIEVSDEEFEAAKPRPKKKVLTEAEKKYQEREYSDRQKELKLKLANSEKGGFSDFFTKD